MAQWFGPKTIGVGVGPRSWQGWLVTVIFLAAIVLSRFVRPEFFGLTHWTRAAFIGVLGLGCLALVVLTYEND